MWNFHGFRRFPGGNFQACGNAFVGPAGATAPPIGGKIAIPTSILLPKIDGKVGKIIQQMGKLVK